MKRFMLEITETGRFKLNAPAESFNQFRKEFHTIEDLKKYLIERYGKMPKGRRKVYTGKDKVIGFLYSFWNKDVSHASPNWYQTDWICCWEEELIKTYFKP